jgi:hypothetical protein
MWDWTVKPLSQNVHLLEATADVVRKKGTQFEILVQADQHFDHALCDRKMMKRHLEMAKAGNMPVVGLGDLLCVMQGREDKRRSADANRYPDREDYFDAVNDDVVDFHKPYAEQLAVYAYGNHETSVKKHNGIDVLERWATTLKADTGHGPYVGGYGGWIFLRFRERCSDWKKTIRIKYFHGSGGGGPVTKGVISTNRRAVYLPDADVIISGHIHNEWNLTLARERVTSAGRVHLDEQLHVQCPTYKEEYHQGHSGWHVERGAPPKPLCGTVLSFTAQVDHQSKQKGAYRMIPNVTRAR